MAVGEGCGTGYARPRHDDGLALPSLDWFGRPFHSDPYRTGSTRSGIRYVEAAMAAAGGNQSEAARLLGVKRETFKGWPRPTSGVNAPVAGEKQPLPVLESDS
ncbi:MAG: helix-turn-helix domain-containing protein [Deltaproteobacteria bacterium]|nr:helix-turn-helix domain-containing protein [Deltaproteobacteria bacterium]